MRESRREAACCLPRLASSYQPLRERKKITCVRDFSNRVAIAPHRTAEVPGCCGKISFRA